MSAGGTYTSGEDVWFDPDEEFQSEIEAQVEFPMADASQGLIEILQENPEMSKVEYLLQQRRRRSSSEEKAISEAGYSRTAESHSRTRSREVSTLALELYELQALQSALEAKRDSWDETVAVQTIVGTVPNDDPRSLSVQENQVQQDLQKIEALLQDAGVDTRTGAPAADDHDDHEYSREKSTTIAAADPQQQELDDHPPSVDSGNINVLAAHEVPPAPAVDLVPSVELGGSSKVTVVQAPELCEKPTISPDIQHDLPAHQEPILMSQYRTHSTTMPSWLVPHTPFAKTPMATYTRVKTRLQDPPHMIPALAAQVSQLTRHEQQPAEGEPKSKTTVAEQIQHPQSLLMQKLKAINLAPGPNTVSAKKILSNKRRSLASILSAPYAVHAIPVPEQEVDPLDDSSIPQYKHWKKIKNLRLHYAQWMALIATCILLIISAHLKQLQDIVWDEIEFWQWLALGLMAVAGRLISGWCVKLLVILIEYNFLMKKRVLYFIFGLRRAMKNWLWQGLIIATWKAVFRNSTDQKTIPTVTRVLWCTFTASGLWVTKVLMVKILANTFHRSAYFDRIQDSLFHQYVLETISKPMKKSSIAAAKKIKPPAKTTEIPKIQPPNKHLPDVHEAKKLGRIDRPLSPIFSGNKVVSTPTAKSKWVSVTKSILASKKLPLKASTITKGKKIKTRKEDEPKKASETPVGSVTKSGFHPNSQEASMEPKSGLEEPKVQLHIAEQSNEAGSKQAQPEQPEALNCEGSAQQQGHPNSQPTCAAGSDALSRQSSADSEDEDLEDDADLAPMVHQDQLQKLTKDSVSAWTLMRLMKVVRTNNLSMFSYTSMLSADWEIVSVPMAKSAAKQIFENMADPGQSELMLKNFMKFLPPDKATQAFASFEVTLNGTITKQALVKWVVDVFKERKSLSLTLNDNRTVIIKINQLLDAVLIAGICAVSFMIMGFSSQTLLVCNSSLLIPAVAIFGNMARTTFESIVFLFVIHPFDVGDKVSVEGVPLLVEEMNIFSTIFLNGANEKISYPNSMLATKPITNVHRSPDQWDLIEIHIDSTTNVPKIGILQDRLNRYIESLPEIWYPRWRFVVKDIDDSSHLNMSITIQHHINFQDGGERWQRRSNMILHLENLMNELEISYKLPPAQINIKAGTFFTEDPVIPISHVLL